MDLATYLANGPTERVKPPFHSHLLVYSRLARRAEIAELFWGNSEFEVSPAHVLEPTYQSIKRHLLSGHWPMGTRLEAVKLADEIGVSMTPVRDSLNQLYGEQLVDFAPGEGFRVPHLSEGQVRDLINLNLILVTAGIVLKPHHPFEPLPDDLSYPDRVASVFHHLADRCENKALSDCVSSISDRLHVVRILDAQLLADAEKELAELSYREIQEIVGVSKATVEYHMIKALEHLSKELGREL